MSSSANRRPRVAGQRRRPGTPREVEPDLGAGSSPESEAPLDTGASDDFGSSAPSGEEGRSDEVVADDAAAARPRLLVPALALAVSLLLLASVLFVTREDPAQRARDASAASATARSTLEQILSYNHATMTEQIPAGQALLTGKFKDEFASTMTKTIVPLAQKDKTVVKARAYEVGVMSQTDDAVTVQAFVNQARTSDAQKEPSIDQNRVIATMTRVGDRWLVSALKAY